MMNIQILQLLNKKAKENVRVDFGSKKCTPIFTTVD